MENQNYYGRLRNSLGKWNIWRTTQKDKSIAWERQRQRSQETWTEWSSKLLQIIIFSSQCPIGS